MHHKILKSIFKNNEPDEAQLYFRSCQLLS